MHTNAQKSIALRGSALRPRRRGRLARPPRRRRAALGVAAVVGGAKPSLHAPARSASLGEEGRGSSICGAVSLLGERVHGAVVDVVEAHRVGAAADGRAAHRARIVRLGLVERSHASTGGLRARRAAHAGVAVGVRRPLSLIRGSSSVGSSSRAQHAATPSRRYAPASSSNRGIVRRRERARRPASARTSTAPGRAHRHQLRRSVRRAAAPAESARPRRGTSPHGSLPAAARPPPSATGCTTVRHQSAGRRGGATASSTDSAEPGALRDRRSPSAADCSSRASVRGPQSATSPSESQHGASARCDAGPSPQAPPPHRQRPHSERLGVRRAARRGHRLLHQLRLVPGGEHLRARRGGPAGGASAARREAERGAAGRRRPVGRSATRTMSS